METLKTGGASMINRISVTGTIAIDLPAENALAVLWDLKSIALYEPKVDSAWIKPETKKTGTYSLRGRFAGVPWDGNFIYELNDRGFHSEMTRSRPPGVSMNGGFVVKAECPDRCSVTHYERYRFSFWMLPLIPLFRPYLAWAMKKEMNQLAEVIHQPDKLKGSVPAKHI
jgi:hypothetical protein